MTRINVVPVDELTDNFILAEYFELPRLFPLIGKAIERGDNEVPETYRLGTGHMRFFYDKLTYLFRRFEQLDNEGAKRGLNLKVDPDVDPAFLDPQWYGPEFDNRWNDYTPTPEAIQLNRDRLQFRRRYDGGSYPSYQGSR